MRMIRDVDVERWKIGELATATGLTVRTLRHYHDIGLLEPDGRTKSGHRLYSEANVRRLYAIRTLRALGLPLEEIAAVLDGNGYDPRSAVQQHLRHVEAQLEIHERLRSRLIRIMDALERAHEPSAQEFIDLMEAMAMIEKYYTPEQLAQLEERRKQLGDEAIHRAEEEWAELIAAFEAEHARGTDPADPRVQQLAARSQELIEQFTGGDPGIRQSLQNMYEGEGPEKASRGAANAEVMAYMGRAMNARSE
jgi:MerR family transcriptional regulator, thiopeptide resistance regulator